MKSKLPRIVRRALVLLTVWAFAISSASCETSAQSSSRGPKSGARLRTSHPSSRIYHDDEIELRVPEGWTIVSIPAADVQPGRFGLLSSGILASKRKLLLEKDRYILGLAYNTEHASGVAGGRFAEVFNIPWPSQEEVGLCSLRLSSCPLPASRMLLFHSLIVETGSPEVREACGIAKDLGYRSDSGFVGERRWLAGFFSTAYGGWFFPSVGDGCGDKAYALTSQARIPEEMPDAGDPKLQAVIQQAIDIVNSIQYKRCPPSADGQ